jgi:hypothetical protein
MRQRLLHFPDGLPLFFMLAGSLGFLAWGFTDFYLDSTIGRPYSTSGIAVFTIPSLAAVLGALGFGVGLAIKLVVAPIVPTRLAEARHWTLPILLILVVALAGRDGARAFFARERAAEPAILVNLEGFQKERSHLANHQIRPAVRVLDRRSVGSVDFEWANDNVSFVDVGQELQLRFGDGAQSLDIPITGLDYITVVEATPVRFSPKGSAFLALMISGRATGTRAMVAIVSEQHRLVYLERVVRFGDLRQAALSIAATLEDEKIIVGWGSPDFFTIGLPSSS